MLNRCSILESKLLVYCNEHLIMYLMSLRECLILLLNAVEDEVQEHLEKAKADKVIEEVVRNKL